MSSWIEMAGSENTPGLAKIRQIKNIFRHVFLLTWAFWMEFQSRVPFFPLRKNTFSPSIRMKKESCQEQSDSGKWIKNVFTWTVLVMAGVKSFQETAGTAQSNL